MTTVSSTSSSSSSTSIAQTLGAGSGIDIKSLVSSLVDAQFSAKNSQFTKKSDALTAQISGVAKLKAGITGFDSALKSLVNGGTLTTQPYSSSTGVVNVSAIAGANVAGLSAQMTVEQLAGAQAATTKTAIPATQAFRGGTLTVNIGSYVTTNGTTTLSPTKSVPITIAPNATLDQIAAQIKAKTGLQTTLVNDNGGVRLTIKGSTGAAQAFEIVGTDDNASDAGQGLATLSVGAGATGTTIGATAKDALLTLDGASFSRPTNSISDLLTGVKLDLVSTTSATTPSVTLGTTAPGSALTQAVQDVVATFNELKSLISEETNSVDGVLRTDTTATALTRALSTLTTKKLATSTTGGPQTLADLGIATQRDGSLTLDTAKLAAVMARDPAGVEAIFATGTDGKGGLSGALSAITATATDKTYGLDAATTRYTKAQKTIADQQTKAGTDATAMSTRLTQQYAAMDTRVAAYKASQTFLEQQIKVWTKSDS
ncbi:flagellar filament capping protein FliD [Sphingomonas sp. KR1UV-12]|uniref:Flagellar hook-associated protein 2 n=1 Tax=Sphingomonas aurea TaxID=3063994 RepID=A0ABT9EN06_9SPHN|nr:flagellar filament capping protein FliD [Sphingomonas sp. KR1UV-12]MDP1028220.1 flagellar filament capping protein FliD [Sphingomonas sp. KR1UV-12]